MASNATSDPIYNNYIEYMIYNNQLDNYNNDNTYYNGKSTNSYNYYVSQISPNNETLLTYGTSDSVDTKQHYRKEIKDNRIKINNYNNFCKENKKSFKLEITYKVNNASFNNTKSIILDEEFYLTIKQYKNKLDKTKKTMIIFNPIRVYDNNEYRINNDNYCVEQIKLIPINDNKPIISNKYLPTNDIIIDVYDDNYTGQYGGETITFDSHTFNQILVYYNETKTINNVEENVLSIQSCSLHIDTKGNIMFKDLNFIKFNNNLNFYIDKFIINY